MVTRLDLSGLRIDVLRKDIKNVHLGVYPPSGRVRISAPQWMTLDAVRLFAISKLPWIKRQQRKLSGQDRETSREYLERESHYVWGQRCLLHIVETDGPPAIELKHRRLVLRVRPGMEPGQHAAVLEGWYRANVRRAVPQLLAKWEPVLGVRVERFHVQRMKTKWGGCSPERRSIRLNTDLARKPPQCLEYIVVHEMMHLIEPTHSERFLALMHRHMPQWESRREVLNHLPLQQGNWVY